jgi:hypothetical protein
MVRWLYFGFRGTEDAPDAEGQLAPDDSYRTTIVVESACSTPKTTQSVIRWDVLHVGKQACA